MNRVIQKIETPSGDTMVVIPLAEYEALLDAADTAAADRIVADIAAGREELIPAAVIDRFLNGDNPIRVWREHRGLTAMELAARAGISPAYLSELESGKKKGGIATLKKVAGALHLTLDDLVA